MTTQLTHYFKTPIAFYNLPDGACRVVYDCMAVFQDRTFHFKHELTYRLNVGSGQIMTQSRVIPMDAEVQS